VRKASPRRGSGPSAATVTLAIAAALSYLALFGWTRAAGRYDTLSGIALAVVLFGVGAVTVSAVTRHDADRVLGLILTALALKLSASFLRQGVIDIAYDGVADADRYHLEGERLAARAPGPLGFLELIPTGRETRFIDELTGFFYAIIGPGRLAGFVLFSFLGFLGLFLFHRAAVLAVPELDQRRYAAWVLLMPSLLFWPSSIGKEAWMLLCLGVTAYGTARMTTRLRGGLPVIALGTYGAFIVRPHVAVVIIAAVGAAAVVGRRPRRQEVRLATTRRAVSAVVMLLLLSVVVSAVGRSFGISGDSGSVVANVLEATEGRTQVGGSAVESTRPNTVAEYPAAAAAVLLRPFLWEARNATMVLAALEATAFGIVVVLSRRRAAATLRLVRRNGYMVYATVFSLLFVFAWSSISNLGILTRQRVQVLPLVLLLLAGVPRPRIRPRSPYRVTPVRHPRPGVPALKTVTTGGRTSPRNHRYQVRSG
jgi:hypothetical protein